MNLSTYSLRSYAGEQMLADCEDDKGFKYDALRDHRGSRSGSGRRGGCNCMINESVVEAQGNGIWVIGTTKLRGSGAPSCGCRVRFRALW